MSENKHYFSSYIFNVNLGLKEEEKDKVPVQGKQ